jgi:phosphoglycerate kinase
VLVRVDFNVPFLNKDGKNITDDTRIREAMPTIKFLSENGAKVMLASHCGRPKGEVNEKMRMTAMATRLSELMSKPVTAVSDCIGPDVDAAVNGMQGGDIIMLENARFYKQEEKNDAEFAEKLAKNATIFVNDAFGTAHRAHASTEGVSKFVDHKVAGFLLEKEIKFLKGAVDEPVAPFAAIVGGAKVSTKIPVIESLIEKCDKIFIGGGMIFTFYRAMGLNVGSSMVEEDFIPMAKSLMEKAAAKGVKFLLPTDVIISEKFAADAPHKTVSVNDIPDGWMGLDIGADSLATFKAELAPCKTVVWNGPMGVFEFDAFSKGTFGVADALAEVTDNGGITIIGGGDSVAAVNLAKLNDRMSHISTGGGASLEMLEGKVLPGVACLDNA